MRCIGVCQSGAAEAISANRLISAIRKPRGTHTVLAGNAVEVGALEGDGDRDAGIHRRG